MENLTNICAMDAQLIPYLTGQRIHPTWQADRYSISRRPVDVVISRLTFPPEMSMVCQPRKPASIQVYSGGYPVTQLPTPLYFGNWRCDVFNYYQSHQ